MSVENKKLPEGVLFGIGDCAQYSNAILHLQHMIEQIARGPIGTIKLEKTGTYNDKTAFLVYGLLRNQIEKLPDGFVEGASYGWLPISYYVSNGYPNMQSYAGTIRVIYMTREIWSYLGLRADLLVKNNSPIWRSVKLPPVDIAALTAEKQSAQRLAELEKYIVVNQWLRLCKNPTSTNLGRIVEIPNVPGYTNRNDWFAFEDPYRNDNRINPWGYGYLSSLTGKPPVVRVGSMGSYTDDKGNYWVAVGPKVTNPAHPPDQKNQYLEDSYGTGKLDIVLKDSEGSMYYVPAVVGNLCFGQLFTNI